MKLLIAIILGTLTCTSCKKKIEPKNNSEIFYDGLMYVINNKSDTSIVKSLIRIEEQKLDSNIFFNEYYSNTSFDTIVAKYHALACFCPNWEIENKKEYSYFEANGLRVTLPWDILIEGVKVKFLVDSVRSFGYPRDIHLLNPNGIKGEVIRYYGYEILKPYKVWAGKIFDHIDPISGDSNFVPLQLTVE